MNEKSKWSESPAYQAALQGASSGVQTAKRGVPVAAAAVPVVLVNTVAFFGQFAFLTAHVHWNTPGRAMFAAALESVAVYLAWHAHVAQINNDSSSRLKAAAALFAAAMGAMNYSHYAAPGWHPTFMAIAMFLMSSISPWLWNIHSRRASRNILMERGLIEEHAVRLGANRWSWHPLRSAQVMYHSTWDGITDPKTAIARYEEHRAARARIREQARNRRSAPAGAFQDVPAPAVHAAVPAGASASAPVQGPEQVIPGTTLNGQTVNGSADLAAGAIMNYQPPTPEKIAEVRKQLEQMDPDDRPAIREVARMLGHEDNQRRKARELLKAVASAEAARMADENIVSARARAIAPAGSHGINGRSPIQIAAPVGTLPGGVTA